ncbi:hypothetical protein TWF694_002343 [Orbilia ellipsospora]|uniref:ubiquitinyl hydrolase 1 n=1 Tax=Orbilia ellipsospora TaxID=2528407 RepID=A0AAV9X329_9PEZI
MGYSVTDAPSLRASKTLRIIQKIKSRGSKEARYYGSSRKFHAGLRRARKPDKGSSPDRSEEESSEKGSDKGSLGKGSSDKGSSGKGSSDKSSSDKGSSDKSSSDKGSSDKGSLDKGSDKSSDKASSDKYSSGKGSSDTGSSGKTGESGTPLEDSPQDGSSPLESTPGASTPTASSSSDGSHSAYVSADPWATDDSRQIIGGIENTKVFNLCYINTALQALAATSLVEWVENAAAIPNEDPTETKDVTLILNKSFRKINRFSVEKNRSKATLITPTPNQLNMPDLSGAQHNAAEFIGRLNQALMIENSVEMKDSPISIETLKREVCLDCGHVRLQQDTASTALIHKAEKTKTIGAVGDSLEHFRRVRSRGGDDLQCGRCILIGMRDIIYHALQPPPSTSLSAEQLKDLNDRLQIADKRLQDGNHDIDDDGLKLSLGLKCKLPPDTPSYPDPKAKMLKDDREKQKKAYYAGKAAMEIKYYSSWSEAIEITKIPDILILEFTNVAKHDATGAPMKLKTKIQFTAGMNFSEYVAGSNRDTESFNLPIRIPDDPSNPQLPVYELRSVMVHQGPDINFGHWICYRREWRNQSADTPLKPQWWRCNEGYTTRVKKSDVLRGTGSGEVEAGGEIVGLIYEKMPDGESLASLDDSDEE